MQQPASQTGNPTDPWFTPWRFALLLALLILATFPQVLFGLETFVIRDYGFFAYPLAHFQRECFRHGELPLWDPYNNCGVPFLAQWNTMPLYPPSLIYLLLPLPWSLSFFCLLHLWFAGFGMFFLARRWTGLRHAEVSSFFYARNARPVSAHLSGNAATATQAGNSFAAAFAGVAFAFNGLTLNLLMWPSHIATLSWMPWVVLAVELAWRKGGQKIILAAFVGALQMLAGGPEIIFLTWILLLALWVQQIVKGESPRVSMFWRFPLVITLVISLAAAQLLPFLDLAAHSQRSAGYADTRWSMPGWGWANFLVPMAFGRTWTEGVFLSIRTVMDVVLLSRHRRAMAGVAGSLDGSGKARVVAWRGGDGGPDFCARGKHLRLSRTAKNHLATQLDDISNQIRNSRGLSRAIARGVRVGTSAKFVLAAVGRDHRRAASTNKCTVGSRGRSPHQRRKL